MVELAYERLTKRPATERPVRDSRYARSRLVQQAEGNPFFLEELIKYIHDRGINFRDEYALTQLDVPSSLEGLVLSRLDQVSESRKIVLKVASVVGALSRRHGCGAFIPIWVTQSECTKT